MTITGHVPEYIIIATAPAQAWGSATPSHRLGTIDDGVLAFDCGMVAMRAHLEAQAQRARADLLEAELRETRRILAAQVELGQLGLRQSGELLHGLDDGEDGLAHPVVDLPGLEAEGRFPRTSG